ncbi:MAG: HepT-like ribonuclease domain-containing protein [Rhizomicrobium sp.]
MSSEAVHKRLEDIRVNIGLAREFIGAMHLEQFASDIKTVYAVTRALEIISEASRFLDDATRARHPDIDWIAVRDAGNVYRHSYEMVSEVRIWDTVFKHLPSLEAVVSAELSQ